MTTMPDGIVIKDLRREAGILPGPTTYDYDLLDENDHPIESGQHLTSKKTSLKIPVSPELFAESNNYLKLRLRGEFQGKTLPRPAVFHLLQEPGMGIRVIGIEH